MRKWLLFSMLILALGCWGCSDDDDDVVTPPASPENQAAADSLATAALADLMDDMEEAMQDGIDPGALVDIALDPYEDDASDAFELDPDCVTAHFLMALIEFFLMSQDEGLQAWAEDVEQELADALGGFIGDVRLSPLPATDLLEGGLLGRSFAIMNRAPLAMIPQQLEMTGVDKADGPLISGLQTIVRQNLLPATDRIVAHLNIVEAHPDWSLTIIEGDVEPDTTEIDLGEVYVLDACNRALRSGFQIMTAYNAEIAPDGDYTWLTDGFRDWGYTDYEVYPTAAGTDSLVIYEDEEQDRLREKAAMEAFEALLEPGTDFLTLWTDPWSGQTAMQTGYAEMGILLTKLNAAYEFIQGEDDDQSDDILSRLLIDELDAAILEIGGSLPEFIGTWETIPDVIDWVTEIMSGPYTVEIPTGETETFDLVVNISALFLTPVADWKTKLPYMEFVPYEEWAYLEGESVSGPWSYNPAYTYEVRVNEEDLELTNIGEYTIVYTDWANGDPVILVDGPGGAEIGEDEFWYFPDYTFGGLFPGLDRAGWIEMLEALDDDPR